MSQSAEKITPVFCESFQTESLKSLLLLNSCLGQIVGQLLGDKDQEGSLLNLLSPTQSESLLEKMKSSPEINRRLEVFAQMEQGEEEVSPKKKLSRFSKVVEKTEEDFDYGVYKKLKAGYDKEVILSEEKSDASTDYECLHAEREPSFGCVAPSGFILRSEKEKKMIPKFVQSA